MGQYTYVDDNRPISPPADVETTVLLAANTANQLVLTFRADPWSYGKLVKIGLAVDATGAGLVLFWPRVNGQITAYGAVSSRNSAPDDDAWLPFPVIVPRSAIVSLYADNQSPSVAFNVTGRMVVQYYDHW